MQFKLAICHGLRDLVDIDDLLRHFSREEKFGNELVSRAEELELCHGSQVWPASAMMAAIVDNVISAPWRKDLRLKLFRQLLYVRSQWLRMSPYLLIPHLIRKALRSVEWRKSCNTVFLSTKAQRLPSQKIRISKYDFEIPARVLSAFPVKSPHSFLQRVAPYALTPDNRRSKSDPGKSVAKRRL